MKNICFIMVYILLFTITGQAQKAGYTIIPYPNKLVQKEGVFEFKSTLTVSVPDKFQSELNWLKILFADEYFTTIIPSKAGRLFVRQNKELGKEEYKIDIDKDKIQIEASASSGCFWAFQTIRQLMSMNGDGRYTLEACEIEDKPTFGWRSFMLDESRNFYGKEVVKSLIDQMALLKFNIFHWHLTDSQGWRIEIKKYPLLTEIGAWRDTTTMRKSKVSMAKVAYAHGGYYTQEDIREIVAYAAKRHITIVPEIDVPGHTGAAIASYPWLDIDQTKIKVPSSLAWGTNSGSFNVADEKASKFIEDVLDEVINLFPGKIIHIGGDEVSYTPWKNSADIIAFKDKKGLKNYRDVQMYFTNRLAGFLEGKGRRLMGWNEILGKNISRYSQEENATLTLNKKAILQYWKGDSTFVKEAIDKGYDLVNSYGSYTYLDKTYSILPLAKAYSFSPVPKNTGAEQARHILGVGCQMWSEWGPKVSTLHNQVFPRIAATAEVGWTKVQNKDYQRFLISLNKLKGYWDRKGIGYNEEE